MSTPYLPYFRKLLSPEACSKLAGRRDFLFCSSFLVLNRTVEYNKGDGEGKGEGKERAAGREEVTW